MKLLTIFLLAVLFISSKAFLDSDVKQFVTEINSEKCLEVVPKVREFFTGLNKEGKKSFLKKAYEKLHKKLSCPRKASVLLKTSLFTETAPADVCTMAKKFFSGRKGKCARTVEKARKYFETLDTEGKKGFVKKLYGKLTEKFPEAEKEKIVELLKALFVDGSSPRKVCFLKRKLGGDRREPSECAKKVMKARKYFKELSIKEKISFVKKVAKKLVETYPNTEKKEVKRFMLNFFFKRVRAGKVCELYKEIFKSESSSKVEPKRDVVEKLQCLYKCAANVPKIEFIKIVLTCKQNVECYKEELLKLEGLKKCVLGCFEVQKQERGSECGEKVEKARKYFKTLDLSEKKEFIKKLYSKLVEKYPEVSRFKVGLFIKALLFKLVPAKYVCKLYKKIFKTRSIVNKKTEKKVQEGDECAAKIIKARKYFKTLKFAEKKEFVKKLYTKLVEKYSEVSRKKIGYFISSLLFKRVSPSYVCKLYKKIFKSEGGSECDEKVKKARKYFKTLDLSGKKEFIKKLYSKLVEKYPEVSRFKVGLFIKALLFKLVPAKYVCKLYKKLFKSKETKTVVQEQGSKCFEKVKKAREFFKGLVRKEKKEFVKKLYTKLIEKYSKVSRKVVAKFIGALLFKKNESPCAIYKKFFKTQKKTTKTIPTNRECLEKCIRKNLTKGEFFALFKECQLDAECYKRNIASKGKVCFSKCSN